MSGSTWTWIYNNVNVNSSSDWELTSGPGNITGIPEAGDIINNIGSPAGFGTIAASIANNGAIYAYAGGTGQDVLEFAGPLTGAGSVYIESGNATPETGAVLQLDSSVAALQTIYFYSASSPSEAPTLRLEDPVAFAGTLANFNGPGDALDLAGETVTAASISGTTLTVSVASGGPLTFNLSSFDEPSNNQLFVSGSEVRLLPAREFDWTGANSGDFGTAGNWDDATDGLNPAISAPGKLDLASFTNGGVIGGGGTVYSLSFLGTNTVTGTLAALSTLTVNGGPLTVTGSLNAASVSLNGGTLAAVDGGRVTEAGNVNLSSGDVISTDGNSSIEFGTSGNAAVGDITVDAADYVNGDGTLVSAVVNNGNIYAEPSSAGTNVLEITGALTGDSLAYIYGGYNAFNEAGAVLQLDSSVASSQVIYFSGVSGPSSGPTLALTDPSGFAGTLDNFDGTGDTLDLVGQIVTGATIAGSTMTVTTAFGGPFTFKLSYIPASTYVTVSGSDVIVEPSPVKVWTGAQSGNFATAGNWNDITNGLTPSATAPGNADFAQFLTGGGTITGTGSVGQLMFAGPAPWALSNAGSLSDNAGLADIGNLTVETGATIVNSGGSVTVDGTNGASASLTIAGAGAVFSVAGTLSVGNTGGGSLAVWNGGSVSALNLTIGTSGSGAVVSVDATSRIEIGGANTATAGSLTVDGTDQINGDGTLAAAVVNNGAINVSPGIPGGNVLEITGALTGTGWIYLENGFSPGDHLGAVLRADSSVAGSQNIDFYSVSDPAVAPTLRLEDPSGFAGVLDYFDSTGDTLDLVGETVTGASVTGSTLTVSVAAGAPLTFNLGSGSPTNDQLFFSGSDVGILPARDLDWTGASGGDFATAGNWYDSTDGLDPAIAAPGAHDRASLTDAGLITGGGTVYQLNFTGTDTVAGTLIASNILSVSVGSLTVTGSLSAAGMNLSGTLAAVSGGKVTENGNLSLAAGDLISVDSLSSVEIGSAGGAAAGVVTVDANEAISGDGTLAAPVANNANIYVYDSTPGSNVMDITGALTGSGVIFLESGYALFGYAGAVLQLGSSVAAMENIYFFSATSPSSAPTLLLSDPSEFSGRLDNFTSAGDTVELVGKTVTGASINGSTMTVSVAGGAPLTFRLSDTPGSTPVTFSGDEVAVATPRTLLWTGASGTAFGDPSDWEDTTDALNPATAAPNAVDTAEFNGGGGPITGTGIAATLSFGGDGVWNLTSGGDLGASGSIVVGSDQLAVLTIDAASRLTTTGVAGAVIANTSGASGSSIRVLGNNSNLTIAGALIVGGGGEGALSVSEGGTVTAASIDEAAGAGGDGVISVAGTGSALTLTGTFTVGDQAAGEVSILGGATVSTGSILVGSANAASSGNVDVEGQGSELLIGSGGVLNVGVAGGGSGVLTIGPGTTLNSKAGVIEAGHASYNNNGGFVDPPFVDITTANNSGLGSNLYDLYVENIGEVQITDGTGIWDTPMMLTGTSVSDAAINMADPKDDVGEWQLSSGGTLVVNANTIDTGQEIVFEDATDTLVIGQIVNNGSAGVSGTPPVIEPGAENMLQAGGFAAPILGYVAGDKITFDNLTVTSATVVNGNTVDLSDNGTALGALAFFNRSGSQPSDSGAAAAALQMPCFAAGTRIETIDGLVRVEDLRVGDRVATMDGSFESIVWIGQRTVNCRAHPRPEAVWPVCVRAGAFGENVPVRDLYLSPDHAVFVNEVLVPVKLLIDDPAITQVKPDHARYFHVELPRHDVILAEGLTVESYLDTGDRTMFANGAVVALYPDFTARRWEMVGCAPLVLAGTPVERIRNHLNARALAIGSRLRSEVV